MKAWIRGGTNIPISTHHKGITFPFFGHQRHDKAWVSDWACALDGGVVFGGTLRAYVKNKGIVETNAKRAYELDEEKRSPLSSAVAL